MIVCGNVLAHAWSNWHSYQRKLCVCACTRAKVLSLSSTLCGRAVDLTLQHGSNYKTESHTIQVDSTRKSVSLDLYCINHKERQLAMWQGRACRHARQIQQGWGEGPHTLGFWEVGCWEAHNTNAMQRSRRRRRPWEDLKALLMWPWHDTHTHTHPITSVKTK